MPEKQLQLSFGPFTVTAIGLTCKGRPGPDEWAAAGMQIVGARGAMNWAIGDWLLFGERYNDEGQYESAAEATGLRRGTLQNLKSVAKAFAQDKRDPAVGWSHHALLAGFDDEVRERMLKETKDRNLSWEELRTHCRTLKQAVRSAMQSWPAGTFGVMLALPPWRAGDMPDPESLSLDDISALAPHVQKITAPDCVMYMLVNGARMASGDAHHVLRSWGFTPRASYAWVRDVTDRSNGWLVERHWHLVVATRGNPVPPAEDDLQDSVQEHDVPGLDVLPAAIVRMIENLHPADAPKVELFAAKERFGWTAWGEKLREARQTPARRAIRVRESAPAEEQHVPAPA